MPLLEPALQGIQPADISRCGFCWAVLQQFAAGDGLALFFEHLIEVRAAELSPTGQAAGGHLADPLLTEPAAAVGEQLQKIGADGLATGLGDVSQQGLDLLLVGQRKVQQGDAFLELPRQLPFRRGDHQGLRPLAQA